MSDETNLFEMRRLEQLSNTVFGVAMTLLAYDMPRGAGLLPCHAGRRSPTPTRAR